MWRTLLRKTGFPSADAREAVVPEQPASTPAQRAAELERRLNEHVETLGPADPRSITARNNLAGKYAQIGRRAEAITHFEQALEEAVRVFGEDHQQTDVIRENLAGCYEDVGRAGDAAQQWEQLLKHRDERLGPVAADTVAARAALAVAYRKCGRYDAAIAEFRRAVEETGLPEQREELRIGLSRAFTAVGRFDEAAQQLRMVLYQRRRRLGARHHDTLMIHHRLGRVLTHAGRTEEAIETMRAAYRNSLAAAGDPEIRMLTRKIRRDLAGTLSAVGRHREAAGLF